MSRRPLVVVGDALLDRDLDGRVERLCPDAPVPVVDDPVGTSRPGGAGLAAALAAAGGRRVRLVTALAGTRRDGSWPACSPGPRSRSSTWAWRARGPRRSACAPAGARWCASTAAVVPRPWGRPRPRRCARWGGPAVLVADYGRGIAAQPGLRRALEPAAARPWSGTRTPRPRARAGRGRRHAQRRGGGGLRGARPRPGRARRLLRARWRARAAVRHAWRAGRVARRRRRSPPSPSGPRAVAAGDPCGPGTPSPPAGRLAGRRRAPGRGRRGGGGARRALGGRGRGGRVAGGPARADRARARGRGRRRGRAARAPAAARSWPRAGASTCSTRGT